jgi:hypothetical protein
MPHNRRVHWPDDTPVTYPLRLRPNMDEFQRPGDRLTLANLNKVPSAGFDPHAWGWGASWNERDPRMYRRGREGRINYRW